MPNIWIGTLAADSADKNWAICRSSGRWGVPRSRPGTPPKRVLPGDELYVWRAEAGWLARCQALTAGASPTIDEPAPWNDGRDYGTVFEMAIIKELSPPYNPGTMSTYYQAETTIPTVKLAQFPMYAETDQPAIALRRIFAASTTPRIVNPTAIEAVEPLSGWGFSADAVRNKTIEDAAIAKVVEELGRHGWIVTKDVQRQRGLGYDLVLAHETSDAIVHAEIKGVEAAEVAFNMTGAEWVTAEADPHFRLLVVTEALTIPQLNPPITDPAVIPGFDIAVLRDFDRKAVTWRLRSRRPTS